MPKSNWDYEIFWKETISLLSKELSEQEYSMWFNNMHYQSATETEIILTVPSSFYKDQIIKRYQPLIEDKLRTLSGNPLKLSFKIVSPKDSKTLSKENKEAKPNEGTQNKNHERKTIRTHPKLNNEYNFEKFVIGENNSFAANASFAISKNPGTAYNPCLI